jgi:hypothetical protein
MWQVRKQFAILPVDGSLVDAAASTDPCRKHLKLEVAIKIIINKSHLCHRLTLRTYSLPYWIWWTKLELTEGLFSGPSHLFHIEYFFWVIASRGMRWPRHAARTRRLAIATHFLGSFDFRYQLFSSYFQHGHRNFTSVSILVISNIRPSSMYLIRYTTTIPWPEFASELYRSSGI